MRRCSPTSAGPARPQRGRAATQSKCLLFLVIASGRHWRVQHDKEHHDCIKLGTATHVSGRTIRRNTGDCRMPAACRGAVVIFQGSKGMRLWSLPERGQHGIDASENGPIAYDRVSLLVGDRARNMRNPLCAKRCEGAHAVASTYLWWDAAGQRRTSHQGEGCEQGAWPTCCTRCRRQQAAPRRVSRSLPRHCLRSHHSRSRSLFDVLTSSIETWAGVAANLGKNRVYNRAGGHAPPGISARGPGMSPRGNAPRPACGFVATDTPIRSSSLTSTRALA